MALASKVKTEFGALAISNTQGGFVNGIAQAVFVLTGDSLGLIVTSITASLGPTPAVIAAAYDPLIRGYGKLCVFQISGLLDGQKLYGGALAAATLIQADYMDEDPLFNGNVTGVPSIAQMLLSTYTRYNQPYIDRLDAAISPFRCPPKTSLVIVHQGVYGLVDGAVPTPVEGKVTLEVGGQLVKANEYGQSTFFGQPLR